MTETEFQHAIKRAEKGYPTKSKKSPPMMGASICGSINRIKKCMPNSPHYEFRPRVVISRVRNTAFIDASRSGSSMATNTIQSFSITIVDPTEARFARVARVMTTPETRLTDVLWLLSRLSNHSGM